MIRMADLIARYDDKEERQQAIELHRASSRKKKLKPMEDRAGVSTYLERGGNIADVRVNAFNYAVADCAYCTCEFQVGFMLSISTRPGMFCRTCAAILQDRDKIRQTPQHGLAVIEYGAQGVDTVDIAECLIEATEEGRLCDEYAKELGVETGQHDCAVCGMKNWTAADALMCCAPVMPGESYDTSGYRARHGYEDSE